MARVRRWTTVSDCAAAADDRVRVTAYTICRTSVAVRPCIARGAGFMTNKYRTSIRAQITGGENLANIQHKQTDRELSRVRVRIF